MRYSLIFFIFLVFGCTGTIQQSKATSVPVESAASLNLREMVALSIAGHSFFIDRFEVSKIDKNQYLVRRSLLPVQNVSFLEAEAICNNRGLRICTVNEWKSACLGPHGYKFGYFTEQKKEFCNVDSESVEPGGYRINCTGGYSVYDMVGNLAEWVIDNQINQPVLAGGSYKDREKSNCFNMNYNSKLHKDETTGVRCCK